ncbi:unnamed protein product [Nezara viridula]|uniref:Uncharacterized protein n=1 Tax=Nezara viridula TaxID=85310 RepID=A0A9P0E396_NEZVI|nr:unnamed protein product [Nezara viridula]
MAADSAISTKTRAATDKIVSGRIQPKSGSLTGRLRIGWRRGCGALGGNVTKRGLDVLWSDIWLRSSDLRYIVVALPRRKCPIPR